MNPRAFLHEVAPRDGLQNEGVILSTGQKLELLRLLAATGVDSVEIGSFVRPDKVPQLADAEDLCARLREAPFRSGVRWVGLVANERGYERYRATGLDALTLLVSACEAHSRANVNRGVAEALEDNLEILRAAHADGHPVRAVCSMAWGSPVDCPPDPELVLEILSAFFEAGADTLLLADTVGHARAAEVRALLERALEIVPGERLGLHMHDTYGRATESVGIAWDLGLRHFDAAAGGCGGCPWAPGAPGNLATETLLECLSARGASFRADPSALASATAFLARSLGTTLPRRDHLPEPDFPR